MRRRAERKGKVKSSQSVGRAAIAIRSLGDTESGRGEGRAAPRPVSRENGYCCDGSRSRDGTSPRAPQLFERLPAVSLEAGDYRWSTVSRVAGALGVLAGAVIIGFSPRRWDTVVLALPRGHGIHAHDLLGMAILVLGLAVLLRAPSR